MTRSLVLIAVLACTRSAAAEPEPERDHEPEHGYVAAGVLVGVDHFLNTAWLLDGGVRFGDLPLAIHVSGAKGGSHDADNGGDFWRATAGLEGRAYRANGSYGFLSLDAGYQHQTWNPSDPVEAEVHRGPLVGTRLGYDAGGEHVRVRAAVELYRYHREFVDHMTEWDSGLGLTIAVGYRL